ncbi:hypothetical protein CEXT_284581 [Caerostris extrusa]|uniref:Uncharacterized protein n=1 Tax=Caerostris extrusa TaxID=172846 RepID=A0AAV4TSW7_CAEEX|nr:hypothetical protein CEXT_284581 [Caerostris extrusa]
MITKVAFLCAALAAVRASGLMGAPLINTGISTSARQQDGPTGGLRRRRTRLQGHRQDQRARNRRQRPAAALINSPYAGPVAPVVNHVAPAAIAAPIAIAAPAIGYGGIGVGAIAAPVAYGGVIGHGAALVWDTEQVFWVQESIKLSSKNGKESFWGGTSFYWG